MPQANWLGPGGRHSERERHLARPSAISGAAVHRVPINALFRLPARMSRALVSKVKQSARLGSGAELVREY